MKITFRKNGIAKVITNLLCVSIPLGLERMGLGTDVQIGMEIRITLKITGNDNGMGFTRREWDGVKVLTVFMLTS